MNHDQDVAFKPDADSSEYTIAQVAKLFSLPASTLRYYEQRQILPPVEKIHGIRRYSKTHLEILRLVECMKACGASLEEIRSFMQLCIQGNSTLPERVAFMEHLEKDLNEKLLLLEQQKKMVQFKLWYFRKSADLQDELAVVRMVPNELPDDILDLYQQSHASLICSSDESILDLKKGSK